MKHYEFSRDAWSLLKDKTIAVSMSDTHVTLFAKLNSKLSSLYKFCRPFLVESETNLSYFYIASGGLQHDQVATNDDKDPIYPELYPSIDISLLREAFNKAPERILILHGEPGVGKTTFLRYLLNGYYYRKVAYIKDKKAIEDSELWYELTDGNYDLIIFDDLDDALVPRARNKDANFVNNLLSYSDGVIRRNTKVVITTNQSMSEIDEAIIRPGRCFDFLTLPPLSIEQARQIWANVFNLDISRFDEIFGNSKNVTQAALVAEYHLFSSHNTERKYVKVGDTKYSIATKIADLGMNQKTGFGR